MKKWVLLIIITAVCVPVITLASPKPKTPIKFFNAIDNIAVLYAGDSAFCSGVAIKTPTGYGILTAGHCCGVYIVDGITPKYEIKGKFYETKSPIETNDMTLNNSDLCVIPTPFKHSSRLKAAPEWEEMDIGILISKFPEYKDRPDVLVQETMVLGIWEKDYTRNYATGKYLAGMSGSPILNLKGDIIGIATVHVAGGYTPPINNCEKGTMFVGMITPLTSAVWPDHVDHWFWQKMRGNRVFKDLGGELQ